MLIITGSPRSGTGFMSQLLTTAGIPCGHEQIYGFNRGFEVPNPQAESSWLAVPHLDKHKDIIHIVRNPMKVLISQNTTRFLFDASDYSQYVYEHLPDILSKNGFDRYMYFYVKWNEMIEKHTNRRYRIEDINEDKEGFLKRFTVEPQEVYSSEKYNTYNPTKNFTLDDIPDSEIKKEFKQIMIRYGYESICSSTK